jgi:hypothetical protein
LIEARADWPTLTFVLPLFHFCLYEEDLRFMTSHPLSESRAAAAICAVSAAVSKLDIQRFGGQRIARIGMGRSQWVNLNDEVLVFADPMAVRFDAGPGHDKPPCRRSSPLQHTTAVDKPARRLKGPFRTVTAFHGKYRRAPRKIGGPQMAV